MQNYLTKIVLKNGDLELSKDLKVKVMKMRIEMSKIRKAFDEDLKQFMDELISDRFKELRDKPEDERTEEEKKEIKEASEQKHESIVTENALELHDMTGKERRKYKFQQEKEKLKELSFWRKVQYLFTYYIWKFLAVVAASVIIVVIIQRIYIATRPVALDVALVNDPGNQAFRDTVISVWKIVPRVL